MTSLAGRRCPDPPPRTQSDDEWSIQIAAHVRRVDARLDAHLDTVRTTSGFGPADRPRTSWRIDAPDLVRELLKRGGKRVRPILTFLGWVAAGGHVYGPDPTTRTGPCPGSDAVVQASCAIEMLHVFALVHDDVMDESNVRRGAPAVHRAMAALHRGRSDQGRGSDRFGESVAILVGDLAHAEAEHLAAELPVDLRHIWRDLSRELVTGQLYDLSGAAAADRRLSYALSVARLKSGNYTVLRPLQLGAAAADAGASTLAALERYGRLGGEAFALRDELLGVFGDPGSTGKSADEDLPAGKPTVLVALAAEMLRGPAAEALHRVGTTRWTVADLHTLRTGLLDAGVPERMQTMIDQRVEAARAALNPEVVAAAGVEQLSRVLDVLANRGQ